VSQPLLDLEVASPEEAAAAIEALLFASGGAEEVSTLAAALGWSLADVRKGIETLDRHLREAGRGVVLQRSGDSVQLVSAPRFGQPVARLLGMERTVKLSSAALETLALVAYRQPVTRSEIESIRGVDSSGVLATLVARELVEPLGRRSTPGNPVEYGTTPAFLQFFGLTSLDELPAVADEPVSADQATSESPPSA
jgi:segregation and condensation protein B